MLTLVKKSLKLHFTGYSQGQLEYPSSGTPDLGFSRTIFSLDGPRHGVDVDNHLPR